MDLTNTTIHQAACMQFVAASIYNWPEKQAFFPPFFLCVIVRVEQTLPPLFFRKSFAYHNPKRMHLCPSEKLFERKTGEEGPQPRYLSLCTSEHGTHTAPPPISIFSCHSLHVVPIWLSSIYPFVTTDRLFTGGQEH